MTEQRNLFDQPAAESAARLDTAHWPDAARFPLNRPGASVKRQVFADLSHSREPLIIAGYTSISSLVEFAAQVPESVARIRLLLGHEPFDGGFDGPRHRARLVPEEARDYWLTQGFSILQCLNLVRTIELMRAGRIEARVLHGGDARLHAKIYLGDDAVTLGSSNFTKPGLEYQWEANVRFTAAERSRFAEARTIAENYWAAGEEATAELLSLLESLLRIVDWQEALARGYLELLEGEWAKAYIRKHELAGDAPLWPSQIAGIAQALLVIETTGSVLVADATGSGKTRMGAHLLRALADRSWRAGRVRSPYTVLVGPPSVERPWEREATQAGTALRFRSHGELSRQTSEEHAHRVDEIRRAQVLAVDEAHNFLNPKSTRTRILLGNLADHAVLFTATPINRGAADLLRLADMLGADNLAPSTVKAFERFLGARRISRTLTTGEIDLLRTELRRFTVRRTKRELNTLVDREPDAYRAHGRTCRYPTHRTHTYELHEPAADRALALEIDQLAQGLHGVAYLRQPLELPDRLRAENWTEESWLAARLKSAARLSAYQVRAALRSSRCALFEHLAGTAAALTAFGLAAADKRTPTGDVRSTLDAIRGHCPENRLSSAVPPAWLVDPSAHQAACEADRARYDQILALVNQLSAARDDAKLDLVERLTATQDRVLAFDSRPITLALFRSRLAARGSDVRVLVATGERLQARREALRALAPGVNAGRLLLLASDAMSEGVNLQAASVVIHLDMPSVVRIAEQRVGRVDRMDSPHESIDVYWPKDAPEFALRTDERFIERYETVEALLGSNLPLPDSMTSVRPEPVDVTAAMAEAESGAQAWDGIEDAFTPVRALVYGDHALIAPDLLDLYRGVTQQVLSRLSLVKSPLRWAFFCLSGTDTQAPRWAFVTHDGHVETCLDVVAARLREHLDGAPPSAPLSDRAMQWLENAISAVERHRPRLLPRRKQVALDEMAAVVGAYYRARAAAGAADEAENLRMLAEAVSRREPLWDWDAVANAWLDVVRPTWYERLNNRRRGARPVLLRDIRADLIARPPRQMSDLLREFANLPRMPALMSKIAASILGTSD